MSEYLNRLQLKSGRSGMLPAIDWSGEATILSVPLFIIFLPSSHQITKW